MTDQPQPITHRRIIIFDCDSKQVDWSEDITAVDLFAALQALLNIAGNIKISLKPTPPPTSQSVQVQG